MSWPAPHELDDLIRRFDAASVRAEEFTHAAHLAVGAWYVRAYGADEALTRLRAGILRLNQAHGTPNSDTRGYHETITRAYVVLLDEFLAARRGLDAAACVRALLADPLGQRDALHAYYSKDLLNSVSARRNWAEPDLLPLRARERSDDALKPGDLVPHFFVRAIDGREVRYADIWQRQQLLLVCMGPGGSEDPPLRAPDTAIVITHDHVRGVPRPGVLIADRWGEIHHVADDIPDSAELLSWLRYVQQRCPECEGEAR